MKRLCVLLNKSPDKTSSFSSTQCSLRLARLILAHTHNVFIAARYLTTVVRGGEQGPQLRWLNGFAICWDDLRCGALLGPGTTRCAQLASPRHPSPALSLLPSPPHGPQHHKITPVFADGNPQLYCHVLSALAEANRKLSKPSEERRAARRRSGLCDS